MYLTHPAGRSIAHLSCLVAVLCLLSMHRHCRPIVQVLAAPPRRDVPYQPGFDQPYGVDQQHVARSNNYCWSDRRPLENRPTWTIFFIKPKPSAAAPPRAFRGSFGLFSYSSLPGEPLLLTSNTGSLRFKKADIQSDTSASRGTMDTNRGKHGKRRRVLITGANKGIGFSTAKLLLLRAFGLGCMTKCDGETQALTSACPLDVEIILGCRTLQKAAKAKETLIQTVGERVHKGAVTTLNNVTPTNNGSEARSEDATGECQTNVRQGVGDTALSSSACVREVSSRIKCLEIDVSREESVVGAALRFKLEYARDCSETCPELFCLINNAGVNFDCHLLTPPPYNASTVAATVDANALGCQWCSQHFLPFIRSYQTAEAERLASDTSTSRMPPESFPGRIINVSSGAGSGYLSLVSPHLSSKLLNCPADCLAKQPSCCGYDAASSNTLLSLPDWQNFLSTAAAEFSQSYEDALRTLTASEQKAKLPMLDSKTGWYLQSYGFSKAWQLGYSRFLFYKLQEEARAGAAPPNKSAGDIWVTVCKPGFVLTDMTASYAQASSLKHVDAGGEILMWLTNRPYYANGSERMSMRASDPHSEESAGQKGEADDNKQSPEQQQIGDGLYDDESAISFEEPRFWGPELKPIPWIGGPGTYCTTVATKGGSSVQN